MAPRAYALAKRTPVGLHVVRAITIAGALWIAVAIQGTWWFWPVEAVCLPIAGRTVWLKRHAIKRWFLRMGPRLDDFLDRHV